MRLIHRSCVEVRKSCCHKKRVTKKTDKTSAKLVERKKEMVFLMLKKTLRPSSTARTIVVKSSSVSTTSAASLVTSVPEPIATPTSALLRAGASLTPSPVMATTSPAACSALTMRCLCPGETRAYTEQVFARRVSVPSSMPSRSSPVTTSPRPLAMPSRRAIAYAVSGLSPVIMTVRTPARRQAATASLTPSLGGSSMAASPKKVRSSSRSLLPQAKPRTRIACAEKVAARAAICALSCAVRDLSPAAVRMRLHFFNTTSAPPLT